MAEIGQTSKAEICRMHGREREHVTRQALGACKVSYHPISWVPSMTPRVFEDVE